MAAITLATAGTSRQFGSSPRVNLPGGLKTLITGLSGRAARSSGLSDVPGAAWANYQRPLTIHDIVTNSNTNAGAIEFSIRGTRPITRRLW